MFRHQNFQRSLASVVLATFTSSLISPLALAQSSGSARARVEDSSLGNNNTLLPVGSRSLPLGKGQGSTAQQTISASALAPAPAPTPAAAPVAGTTTNASADYAHSLAKLMDLSAQVNAQTLQSNASALIAVNSIRNQYQTLVQQEQLVTQGFTATASLIKDRKLPTSISQRHDAMVAEFTRRASLLKEAYAPLDSAAAGKTDASSALKQWQQYLKQYASQSTPVLNGNKLPWGTTTPQNNSSNGKVDLFQLPAQPAQPAQTARQFERRFPRSVLVASNGSLSGLPLPDAVLSDTPTAADLAATDDVQLTSDISTLAASLQNNPVAIYNYVRNSTSYRPGYGSLQGAAQTLQAKSGNATDSASLLIALYRAAGIPSRYVYGTIQVPSSRILSWLHVDNTAAALTLLTQAGIPNKAIVQNGSISAIQLEHTWVEAFIDASPSRGAKNRQASAWFPLDPSFKQSNSIAALGLRSSVALNESGVFDAARQGATCSADAGKSLNQIAIQTSFTNYQTQLNQVLGQQGSDLTVGGVLGSNQIAPENYSILMGSLPYSVIAQGASFTAIPNNLKGALRIQLYASPAAQAQNSPSVSYTSSYPGLANKRLTLSFTPVSQADADVLAAYMPAAHSDNSPITASEFPASIPGYLVQLKAEIRLDGQIVATGGNFSLGSELPASIGNYDPAVNNWNDSNFIAHAGDYHAIVADTQGINPTQLDTVRQRLAATQAKLTSQPGSVSRDDLTGDLLHQTILAYFATTDTNSAIFQRAAGVIEQRLPSHGRAVAQVSPDFLLGMVNNVSFPGVILDIDRLKSAVASQSTGLSPPVYSRQSNQRNAAYAHLVLDKHYGSAANAATNTAAVTAASAVRILAKAASQPQTQPVYAVTSSNLSAALLNISLTADQSNDLQNAVAAGYRVLLPQNPATLSGWSGQAMQIEDPQTGAGAYRLSGGSSGSGNNSLSGTATAAIFAPQGMAWLALAQPVQAQASITPAITASQSIATILASMLPSGGTGGNDNSDQIRWAYFSGQADVANGLFLARLAGAQSNTACDSLSSIIAANLGTATGYDDSGTGSTGVTSVPVITSAPVTAAVAAQAYSYPVAAQDPKGAALSFSLTDAPSGMSISNTGVISWAQPVIGNFNVTVRADNGRAYAEQRYQLSVSDHALALSISLAVAPALVNLGDKVTITVLTNGGTGAISTSLNVDGQAVPLNTDGTAILTASTGGAHQIAVTAKDDLGTINKTSLYSVKDPSDTSTPVAQITAPIDDADVTAPGLITGTASAKSLAYYQLLLRATDSNDWQEIGRGYQSVTNGNLGKLDPTQLQNGIYDLNLIVVNTNGVQANHLITLDVNRNLKIGQFSISFEDVNIQASGIPIRVTRTYDTRRKSQNLDFGYGWSVDYQNVQIRKNMVLGLQWNVITSGNSVCLRPAGKRKVDITLPTGEVARFTAANKVECGNAIPLVEIQFSALPGTTSTLELVDVPTSIHTQSGMLIDGQDTSTGTVTAWNPKNYKLTTEDNYKYFLTDGIGITQIKDPNGNTLTYNDTGVAHSNGTAITFTRDANHHITGLTDPSGKQIRYTYSASGDLMSMTDRNGAVSSMTYDRNHGLASFTDPDGHLAARYEYDADGRLIAAYDANGKAIQMNHDIDNNRETVTDRRGYKTTYTYDAYGNVTQIINPLNQITTYTYDANGNQASVTNAAGQTTLSSYDPKSYKQTSETDALGHTTSWAYDQTTRSQLLASVDQNGNAINYNTFTEATQITEPLGRTSNYRFDNAGNISIVNVAGQITQYKYDTKGNKISETDAAGNTITYAYDANNKEISRSWIATVNVNGVPTQKTVSVTRILDAGGRVLSETDPLGITTKIEYTAGGQVSANVDPQGRRTAYAYDSTGRLASTTYPDGGTTSSTYDASGNKTSDTDRQGKITRYEYDALDRLVKTIASDGTSTSTNYDTAGRVASTTDAGGNTVTNGYDAAGRLISRKDAGERETTYEYDNVGNRTKVTDSTGKVTQFQYDGLNRLTKVTYPDNTASTTAWRLDGRKDFDTDQAGNTTQYGYDAVGSLNVVIQTNAATQLQTSYGYDGNGNKISQTDAQGRVTTWTYDINSRLTSRTLPSGQTERFQYDLSGNLNQKTDFAGQVTTYVYNSLNQLIQIQRPDGSATLTSYTVNGQISAVTVSGGSNSNGMQNGQTSYQYDARDRITKQTNPDGSYLAYGYDANGNITERSTAAGTVKYSYNAIQQLVSVTDAGNKTTSYSYDNAGRLTTATAPNGIIASYAYDTNGRLSQVLHQKANGDIVTGSRYTFALNGQRTKIEEFDSLSTITANVTTNPVRTINYQYDGVNRLMQELVKDRAGATTRTTDYQYDKVGNRAQKIETTQAGTETTVYSYDSNDRLMQEVKTVGATQSTTSYTWDDKGNLITKTVAGQVTVYGWNADNRLIEIKQGATQASATTIAKYSYDAASNRVQKTETDKTTNYLTDNSFTYAQTVQESITQGSTTQTANYVWGNGLIQQSRAGQNSYYHADGLGSTKALTDATGNATDAYQYDAFGIVVNHVGTTQNAYRYTGEYFDDSINLQYNRARWYAANAGRFISMDEWDGDARTPLSLNKFVYANSDPVNRMDPSGAAATTADNFIAMNINSILINTAVPIIITGLLLSVDARIKAIVNSRAKAKECASSFVVAPRSFGSGDCPDVRMPIVFMSEVQLPGIGEHVLKSQEKGSSSILHRSSYFQYTNRLVATTKCALGMDILVTKSGSSCDEYPFASSIEGGMNATVAKVPILSNLTQGGVLGAFYTVCGVIRDFIPLNEFVVIPVASATQSFQCRWFGSR